MSGIDETMVEENEEDIRVIEVTTCLGCPYHNPDDWTSAHYCMLDGAKVIESNVEEEIMPGCKLMTIKDAMKLWAKRNNIKDFEKYIG